MGYSLGFSLGSSLGFSLGSSLGFSIGILWFSMGSNLDFSPHRLIENLCYFFDKAVHFNIYICKHLNRNMQVYSCMHTFNAKY